MDPLLRAFELLLRRRPQAPLAISPRRRATAGDVDALSRAALRRLREGPLPPWSVVGLAACNGPGLLASLVAVRRAGAVALLLDGLAPESESRRIAAALGAATLLRCRCAWPRGAADWRREEIALPDDAAPLCLPGAAVVKLTSGSTGVPRGIATPGEALLADDAALSASMGLLPDDRLLAAVPLSHSYGLSSLALPALTRGAPLVMGEESDPLSLLAAAALLGASVFPTVPAYLDALLRLSQPPAWPPSLRLVISAGAPLPPATAAGFRERFGRPVHVFYGASECGGICYDRDGGAGERGTVGAPVEGVRVTLRPPAGGGEGAAGEGMVAPGAGEVVVASAAVADGYVPGGDERLRRGLFVSRDLGLWRGGELVLRGRGDAVINIKGRKVDPLEVERVLAQLEGVQDVAVLGVPVPGRASDVLRAVIACQPGRLTAEEALAWCRRHLSAHKVPRSLVLVPRMPRTARGKLDRSALLALDARAISGAANGG